MSLRRWIVSALLMVSATALGASSPSGARALVGSSASFFHSAVCRHLGCALQGVRRARLEGSGNPVRVYGYGLRAGGQVEVTRYDLKGQSGDGRISSLLFMQKTSQRLSGKRRIKQKPRVAGQKRRDGEAYDE